MITSLRNQRIIEARRLARRRQRRATGRTTIDGPFLLQEAIAAGVLIHDLFAMPDDSVTATVASEISVPVTHVSAEVIGALASSVNPRGPVSVVSIPLASVAEDVDTVVLWDVADPGNAGTIIRTAAAFGFQVIATANSVDLWSPKVLRSAVGGHFRTSVTEGFAPDLALLREMGMNVVATAVHGPDVGALDFDSRGVVALIVGNEAHGLPDFITDSPEVELAAIPMPGGTESLNAAVSAGIFMYLRSAHRGSV